MSKKLNGDFLSNQHRFMNLLNEAQHEFKFPEEQKHYTFLAMHRTAQDQYWNQKDILHEINGPNSCGYTD